MASADELLNGSFATPQWGSVDAAAATSPSEMRSDKPLAAARSVMLAWLVLFGILIVANVVTLSVQR